MTFCTTFGPAVRALFALSLCTAFASAQLTPVAYGDPARSGNITSPNQTDTYFFSGTQDDALRITFASQNSGYPSYTYYHQLEVRQGTTVIGSAILGLGEFTVTLPNTGYYSLHVRARNNQSTGWYSFQLNRVNDPVGADRMALDWNLEGRINSRAAFDTYTIRAEAGSTALLRLTCQNSGYPSYTYYHYAQLVDSTGTEIASVQGNGSTTVAFQQSGVYTLFIAARNWQSTGWYAASLECQSWPFAPCDTVAHSSNFGSGLAGTNGVPSLTTTSLPRLGTTFDVAIGNSAGQASTALFLVSLDRDNEFLSNLGGRLLVYSPFLQAVPLPTTGATVTFSLPNDPLVLGLGFAAQSLVFDTGAPADWAFSRGLLVLLGN